MMGLIMAMGSVVQAEDLSIATVNMQEIIMVHPAIMEAQEELQQKQMEMMAELEEMDEEEQAMQGQQMQMEMQALQEELFEEALNKVESDIAEIAEDLGYNVVLNIEGIVSGEEALETEDITDEVLEEFNGEAQMQPQF